MPFLSLKITCFLSHERRSLSFEPTNGLVLFNRFRSLTAEFRARNASEQCRQPLEEQIDQFRLRRGLMNWATWLAAIARECDQDYWHYGNRDAAGIDRRCRSIAPRREHRWSCGIGRELEDIGKLSDRNSDEQK